jgi:hypothetical protein
MKEAYVCGGVLPDAPCGLQHRMACQPRPAAFRVQPGNVAGSPALARFNPLVVAINRVMKLWYRFEARGLHCSKEQLYVSGQGTLIAFERQDIIGALVQYHETYCVMGSSSSQS